MPKQISPKPQTFREQQRAKARAEYAELLTLSAPPTGAQINRAIEIEAELAIDPVPRAEHFKQLADAAAQRQREQRVAELEKRLAVAAKTESRLREARIEAQRVHDDLATRIQEFAAADVTSPKIDELYIKQRHAEDRAARLAFHESNAQLIIQSLTAELRHVRGIVGQPVRNLPAA